MPVAACQAVTADGGEAAWRRCSDRQWDTVAIKRGISFLQAYHAMSPNLMGISLMRARPRVLCASTLNLALFVGTAAIAADLPREGTFTGTFSGFGTYKVSSVGAERIFVAYDENGFSLSDGPLDHMTWHCWGTTDYINGIGQGQGYCVAGSFGSLADGCIQCLLPVLGEVLKAFHGLSA